MIPDVLLQLNVKGDMAISEGFGPTITTFSKRQNKKTTLKVKILWIL